MLFLMWSIRQKGFAAEEYAYKLGYGAILKSALGRQAFDSWDFIYFSTFLSINIYSFLCYRNSAKTSATSYCKIAEFLGMLADTSFTETKLESSIISNLHKFLLELGKGYAFVTRQQHTQIEKENYYIDLVFYNYILKCLVLIDLKTNKVTHQGVGQSECIIKNGKISQASFIPGVP